MLDFLRNLIRRRPASISRHPGYRRRRRRWSNPFLLGGLGVVALVLGLIGVRAVAIGMIKHRVIASARERGLHVGWRALHTALPGRVEFQDLLLETARGDTAFSAESLAVRIDPWSVVFLRPRLKALALTRGLVRLGNPAAADPDTLIPDEPRAPSHAGVAPQRVQRTAQRFARLLLAPARELPAFTLRDVVIQSSSGEDDLMSGVRITWLDLSSSHGGVKLAAQGHFSTERSLPFDLTLDYGHDDRIVGGLRVLLPSPRNRKGEPLSIAVDGRIVQDRARGEMRIEDGSRVTLGKLPFRMSGSVASRGPHVRFALAADGVTQRLVEQSLPGAALGPLREISVRGSFDYRVGLDLDFARPQDVDFSADVIPHGLRLEPSGTRLNLLGLDVPFVAQIHLPHGVIATRELSRANPNYRALDEIDSLLVHAVVTNEDGLFFHHRGFNTEAVKMAIAANLKAGEFRRGAGTITMQLVRNLYLGHEKTLARKAQEVVLTWILEHLTGLTKRRLLEIYMNIIEWGPGVHGANEATRFYFDHDAGRVTVDEALFLSTVVPAPKKWRYRFGPDGEIKKFESAQMHYIGGKMIAKEWLLPEMLPPRESLNVELRGPARSVIAPADSAAMKKTIDPGTSI